MKCYKWKAKSDVTLDTWFFTSVISKTINLVPCASFDYKRKIIFTLGTRLKNNNATKLVFHEYVNTSRTLSFYMSEAAWQGVGVVLSA